MKHVILLFKMKGDIIMTYNFRPQYLAKAPRSFARLLPPEQLKSMPLLLRHWYEIMALY